MKVNVNIWLATGALYALLVQDQATRELQLSVSDPRPVAAAALELERRHGIPISYEDAPYAYTSDTEDVTLKVRQDLDKYPPGKAPPVLIPRLGAIELSYAVDKESGRPVDLDAVLQAVIDTHGRNGNAGKFKIVHSVEGSLRMTQLVPIQVRNRERRSLSGEARAEDAQSPGDLTKKIRVVRA